MQGTTLVIGILGSILVLLLRPAYALAAYFSVLVWYPDYLRVSLGTIDISAGRIVVTVLLLRCLLDDRLRRKFVWSRLDTWVALSMLVYVVMYCITRPSQESLENRSGFLMDTWFVYLTARLIVTDKTALTSFVKGVGVVLGALAVLGAIEAYSHWQPFLPLRRFRPWDTIVDAQEIEARIRFGLARAVGPFSHSIMFGACFVMFLPLIWALRRQRGNWASLAKLLSAMAVLGALSSMSSGPWGMLIVVILCMAMETYRHRAKGVLALFVLMCILVGIVSNRPFYHVLLELSNLGKGDWYQRAKLIDSGIKTIDEWWLAGYGGKDPGWGAAVGEAVTDCNNEFLLKGVQNGMLGVIALVATLAMAFRGLVRAFKETTDKELRSLYWAMGCALVGVIVIWQGVSFFGTPTALFYCLLGTIGSSIRLAKYVEPHGRTLQIASSNIPVLMYGGEAERAPADAVRGIDGAQT
jgi:hypothetical protein